MTTLPDNILHPLKAKIVTAQAVKPVRVPRLESDETIENNEYDL